MTPIDAVIPWVDGNAPAQRQRLESYLACCGAAAATQRRSDAFR
ncbi:MAG: hypothetical protein ABI304_12195 [Rudaea sp.]